MELKKLFHLEERIYAEHAKDLNQNQEQGKQLAELVEEQDFKQLDKVHSWYNKCVEIVMVKDQ